MSLESRASSAMNLLASGQVQQAAQLSSRLLAEAPDSAPVLYLACEVAVFQNQLAEALGHINRAIETDDRQFGLVMRKAQIEVINRLGKQAQDTVSEVAARFPDDAAIQLEAARIFTECGNHAGAEALLLKAGETDARNPKYLFAFSTNQFFLGKTDEAEKAIAEYLDLQLPVQGRKWLMRAQLRKQTADDNHVGQIRKYLASEPSKEEAVNCHYALAKELEDLGEHARSFEALEAGAAIQRQLINFKLADELANLKDLADVFQPESYARIPDSTAADAPVFIVGMPRTGTTLVERMITCYDGVRSADESNDFTFAFSSVINAHIAANPDRNLAPLSAALEVDYGDIAGNYRSNMQGMLGKADRYLDKTPYNFLYCGLIMKAFPNARILHLVRDPMDTCYAVFKTLFSKAYYYSYDLTELADYYVGYRQLMEHWNSLIPGAILDVRYEELVSNPLDVSKRIAHHVGLEWSENMIEVQESAEPCATASAAQVREPIYTSSVGLWRNHETGLEAVKQRLSAAGLVDDTGNPLV